MLFLSFAFLQAFVLIFWVFYFESRIAEVLRTQSSVQQLRPELLVVPAQQDGLERRWSCKWLFPIRYPVAVAANSLSRLDISF